MTTLELEPTERLDQKRLPYACRPVGPIGPKTQAVGYHGGKSRRPSGPINSERCLVVACIDSHMAGSSPRHGNVAFSGPRNERRRVQKLSRLPLRTDPKSCRSADPCVPHRRAISMFRSEEPGGHPRRPYRARQPRVVDHNSVIRYTHASVRCWRTLIREVC